MFLFVSNSTASAPELFYYDLNGASIGEGEAGPYQTFRECAVASQANGGGFASIIYNPTFVGDPAVDSLFVNQYLFFNQTAPATWTVRAPTGLTYTSSTPQSALALLTAGGVNPFPTLDISPYP